VMTFTLCIHTYSCKGTIRQAINHIFQQMLS
jgi:hypothetical protein